MRETQQTPPDLAGRLPPGQVLTQKFPVLSAGPTPLIPLGQWRFHVFGMVEEPVELTWEQFMSLPQAGETADFHCVTQWSRLGNRWEGVPAGAVLDLAKPALPARAIMVHCYGGYTTNLELEELRREQVLFAHRHDGRRLEPDHGGPLRLVVPHLYGWKSAKWVNGLELMAENRPGFWEQLGYHPRGEPWREERFWDREPNF